MLSYWKKKFNKIDQLKINIDPQYKHINAWITLFFISLSLVSIYSIIGISGLIVFIFNNRVGIIINLVLCWSLLLINMLFWIVQQFTNRNLETMPLKNENEVDLFKKQSLYFNLYRALFFGLTFFCWMLYVVGNSLPINETHLLMFILNIIAPILLILMGTISVMFHYYFIKNKLAFLEIKVK